MPDEQKDVKIEMRPLEVKLSDDMEGNRSSCCYEPATLDRETLNFYVCSKCGGKCELLTDEDKVRINATAATAINDMLGAHKVLTIVIHKPTNGSASQVVSLPEVRAYAEAVVKSYGAKLSQEHGIPGMEAPRDEFVIVEVEDGQVRVSELGNG